MAITTSQPKDLTKILRPYRGEWVALSDDEKRVLGHGPTPEIALKQARGRGTRDPILMGVPDKGIGSYIL